MRLRRLLCLAPVVVLACADHTPTAPAHVREFNRPVTSPDAAVMTDSTSSNQELTASFKKLPATHNGETTFTFELHFSAEPSGLSYKTVRDSLFDVTNGRITGAGRVTQGSNLAFRVILEPSRLSDISFTVRGTTDCGADHAVCTADGRKLAGGESATVDAADLITLRVADAEVVERAGATLDFVVRLSRAANKDVLVQYRAYDGTAEAGADYEAVSSNFTFAPGDTTRTISVVVLTDSQKEESETVKFWLWGVPGMSAAQITRAHAIGTIHDSRPGPDLKVGASADDSTPETGGSFTLSATVTNSGDGASASTTLRYYRSSDSTVTASDTQVGTDAVGALAAAGTSAQTIGLTAPSSAGTYYYGACADTVANESDTANNCSAAVRVEVSAPLTARFANLPATHDGRTVFTFEVHFSVEPPRLSYKTVRDGLFDVTNGGVTHAGRVTPGSNLAFAVTVEPSTASDISLTVRGTTDCKAHRAVCTADGRMLAGGASDTVDAVHPDLEVAASVEDGSPEPGGSFTLSATVMNSGDGASDSTTLRYYRSSDSTITTSDTQIGTDAVGALAAAGTSAQSVDLTAPSTEGTYYYGACADTVTNESDTANNCSESVRVEVEEDRFDIDLYFTDDVEDKFRSTIRQAAERWESILAETELDDVTFSGPVKCMGLTSTSLGTVDDHAIIIHVDSLDGYLDTFAKARPCHARASDGTPVVSAVIFDERDIGRVWWGRRLYALAIHEVAHGLGFANTFWKGHDLFNTGTDPHFTGALAVAAFNAAGGTSYTGAKVPLESRYNHWRQSVLDNEVMTPKLAVSGRIPLSAITLQAMADLGYVVDLSQADDYELPGASSASDLGSDRDTPGDVFDLSDDVVMGPVRMVDTKGRIVRIVSPSDGVVEPSFPRGVSGIDPRDRRMPGKWPDASRGEAT